MSLATLHRGVGAEHGLDGLPEALGPVKDHEEPVLDSQAALPQLAEEGAADHFVLGGRLDKPQDHLLARDGDAHGVRREGLPIEEQSHEIEASRRRSWRAWSCFALARMKRRETEEAQSPKASGTASALAA
jgi:hypothetical protein